MLFATDASGAMAALCDVATSALSGRALALTADMQWHWLRASVVVDGRSITLYEEVHPRE